MPVALLVTSGSPVCFAPHTARLRVALAAACRLPRLAKFATLPAWSLALQVRHAAHLQRQTARHHGAGHNTRGLQVSTGRAWAVCRQFLVLLLLSDCCCGAFLAPLRGCCCASALQGHPSKCGLQLIRLCPPGTLTWHPHTWHPHMALPLRSQPSGDTELVASMEQALPLQVGLQAPGTSRAVPWAAGHTYRPRGSGTAGPRTADRASRAAALVMA